MKWFKHYSNADCSNALTEIKAKYGFEGMGRYWTLLEKMAQKFDGESDDVFVFSIKDLKDILGFYHVNHMRMYLQCMSDVGLMSFQWSDHVVRISTSILLKLQSKDFKYNRKRIAENDPKNKDIRRKNKEVRSNDTTTSKNILINYGLDKNFKSKHDAFISTWNNLCGQKRKAPLTIGPQDHQKIKNMLEQIPSMKDWEKIIKFAVQDDFWKKTVHFRWLINPEKLESIFSILNQAENNEGFEKKPDKWI